MARHGPVFQSHILGKPTVIVGDLVNWQKVLSTDFKHVGQYFTESFAKASGVAVVADKNQHAFQVTLTHPYGILAVQHDEQALILFQGF